MANKEQGQKKEAKKSKAVKTTARSATAEPPKSKKEAKKEKREVVIKTCGGSLDRPCRSPYQDRKYGANKRVMNPLKNPGSSPPYHRCTVCGREQ